MTSGDAVGSGVRFGMGVDTVGPGGTAGANGSRVGSGLLADGLAVGGNEVTGIEGGEGASGDSTQPHTSSIRSGSASH